MVKRSFASKLTQAVNTLAARCPETCKQARERAERERNRYGLPVAMERKLALRKSAALRECHWDGATRPSELILELQVAADQHIRVFVVKVRRNLFPNLGPLGALAAR
jgi:hypothetical protein